MITKEITRERYLEILQVNLNINSEAWFEVDADPDQDLPDDFIYSGTAALALVEQGETFWDCPGWVADIAREFKDILFDGDLKQLQSTAALLLSTMPEDPPDEELSANLSYLAEGQFCVVYQGRCCHWTNTPEFYRKNGNLKMVEYAKNARHF